MDKKWLEEAIKKIYINFHKYEDFENIETIGRGAFGKVSRAEWANRDMFVAIKSIEIFLNADEDTWRNFIRELRNHHQVDYHQNIIGFYGISKDPTVDGYLMVLEYANQGTLRKYLQDNKDSMNWSLKLKFAKELTSGIKCLHEEGIVHRDLHSCNVLIHDNTIKIADLGLSKQLSERSLGIGEIRGCIPYVEPQALKNNEYKLDKRSDMYSVGVLLWEISSGHPPFGKFINVSTMLSIISGKRETPVINTPLKYQSLYIKCWDDDPNKRPLIKDVSEELKNMNPNCPQSVSCLTLSDEITSLSSDMSDSIFNELEEIKNRIENNEEIVNNSSMSISKEEDEFLKKIVTIFINNVNNGNENYQTAIDLSCFIGKNNRDPIDILNLLTNTQEIEHHKCIIGLFYLNGYGTDLDKTRAFNLFKSAAENDNSMGYYFLGQCYLLGTGTKVDVKMAFSSFLKSAEDGNIAGQCLLGYCYQKGIGTEKNDKDAVEWYQKSAEKKNYMAQCNLAYCYQNGIYLKQDYTSALNLYQRSANAGNPTGKYYLGCCYQEGIGTAKDEIKAFRLFDESARVDNILAQFKVGWCNQYGKGTSKNEGKAFIWYRKSAESGNVLAQNQLAYCYSAGIGIKKDETKAFKWYQKSATRGNTAAQFNLGIYYNFGIGTKTDKEQAKLWYEIAAEDGHVEAKKRLKKLLSAK